MSSVAAASCDGKGSGEARQEKKPLKPCCACPETKKARDAWFQRSAFNAACKSPLLLIEATSTSSIIEKGEENCGHLIEAHKECMRALGFKI